MIEWIKSPQIPVSRRRLYARAPEEVIRRVAAEYAESYHLPALRGLAGPETHEAGD